MKKIFKFALLTPLLFFLGCATGPIYQGPPAIVSAQSVMTGKACSTLPFDHNPNINLTPGWKGWSGTTTPPVGMSPLNCGNTKYIETINCTTKTACSKPMTWGTATPATMDAGKVVWVLDILQGSVEACAENSDRFGAGSLECVPTACTSEGGMSKRCIYPVIMEGQHQAQSPTMLKINALSDGIVIGQIGTTTPMN